MPAVVIGYARVSTEDQNLEALLEATITDSVSPAICMDDGCDYSCEMEPDQDRGWCEACGTRLHEEQRQSCTISICLRRVPLRVIAVLPQCGQRSGRLVVCGTRAVRDDAAIPGAADIVPQIVGYGKWTALVRVKTASAKGEKYG